MPTLTTDDGRTLTPALAIESILIVTRGEHAINVNASLRWPDGSMASVPADGDIPGDNGRRDVQQPILNEDGTPNTLLGVALKQAAAALGVDLSALSDEAASLLMLNTVRDATAAALSATYDDVPALETLLS
jgi:hypothetical protein